MSRLCLLVFIACFNSFVASEKLLKVEVYFIDNQIVPDVVPVAPTRLVTVQFSNGIKVELGNEVTPTQAKDIPTVSWDASPDKWYTIAVVDPDAPSRANPTSRAWNHWLVGNIPGDDVAWGHTIAEYVGAGPGQDSGKHRYVFVVYGQPSYLEFDEPTLSNRSADNRALFSVDKFTTKYNMGDPIAGNFYLAEYDSYVPILYEQLGLN